MSAHIKTPYITPSMDFSSGKGVVRGRRGQQLVLALLVQRVRQIACLLPMILNNFTSLNNIYNKSLYLYGRTHM